MRRHTGSQSINGRVLLIELPTNSVFMRLRRRRRRVHECWGRGRGRGRASLAIGSLQIEMLEPAEIVFNLQAATTLLRLLAAHNPKKKKRPVKSRGMEGKGAGKGTKEGGKRQAAIKAQTILNSQAHALLIILISSICGRRLRVLSVSGIGIGNGHGVCGVKQR